MMNWRRLRIGSRCRGFWIVSYGTQASGWALHKAISRRGDLQVMGI